ncbi:MAG: hypothetical protein V3T31_05420 [candidate division Zixibacteria bacterium]
MVSAMILLAASSLDSAVSLSEQAVTFSDYNYVNYVASSSRSVYFATTNGVIRYDIAEQRWKLPLTLDTDGETNITRVWAESFDDQLYLETSTSLWEYSLAMDAWYPLTELPDLTAQNQHLSRLNTLLNPPFGYNYTNDGYLIDKHGRSFAVSDILDDNSGLYWIGIWGYGPALAGSISGAIELLPFGLLQRRVNAICADDSLLWVSGAVVEAGRTGLTGLNRHDFSSIYIESGLDSYFPSYDVNCLAADSERIFVGTNEGLLVIDKQRGDLIDHYTERTGLVDDNIISLCLLSDSLFIGSATGLSLISIASDSIRTYNVEALDNRIIYDFQPTDEHLWIGSSAGALRLNRSTGQLQRFTDPTSVLFGSVYDLDLSGDFLWFASDDGAVRLNLKTGEVEPFNERVRSRTGRAIAANETVAILSSDDGMFIIYHDRDTPITRELTIADGLPSAQVFSLLMDGDYVWVGTDHGLTRFLWNNPRRVD